VKENEIRYLVHSYDEEITAPGSTTKRSDIIQGYFDLDHQTRTFRVRIVDDCQAWDTFKDGFGRTREEAEYKIPLSIARAQMKFCSHFLEKTRFYSIFDSPGIAWIIDIYKPPLVGLIIAEAEFSDGIHDVDLPPWLYNATEVTNSISNIHLARAASQLRSNPGRPLDSMLSARKLPKIAIVGGPGSGKSGVMDILKKEFIDIQFVPEAATILIKKIGINPSLPGFNSTLYRMQCLFEATSEEQAMVYKKIALVTDRGTVDIAAYCAGGLMQFEHELKTTSSFEYAKYDCIIYLETPSREVYEQNKTNNSARSESYHLASQLGMGIKMVWQRHPNFHSVFAGNWGEKIAEVKDIIQKTVRKAS